MTFQEQLGVQYERVLVSVDLSTSAARDRVSGRVVPVQLMPALPGEASGLTGQRFALVDVMPGESLDLEASHDTLSTTITIAQQADHITITNGSIAITIPASARWVQPFPGPLLSIRSGSHEARNISQLVDAPHFGSVETFIESIGPAGIQWRTNYRWGGDAGTTFACRWASGSDTICIVETCSRDTDAFIEFHPLGDTPAEAFRRGGGEGVGPMLPLKLPDIPASRQGAGRRSLGFVSHIGYWNQWNFSWVGFAGAGDAFVGIFPMSGSKWDMRGRQRLEIMEDNSRGAFWRCPIRKGTRYWGLTLSTREASDMASTTRRCLPNRRKTSLSDLPIDKVRHWELDPALEPHEPRLVTRPMIASMRQTISDSPELARTCRDFLVATADTKHLGRFAAALAVDDGSVQQQCAQEMVNAIAPFFREIGEGGYERLIIFDGRRAKPIAFDLDVLWAEQRIDEASYRAVRRMLLAEAYMFVDQDFSRYHDFLPDFEPQTDLTVYDALHDDMGDCPVPPNFVSEFFSTTGVMAELFAGHPMASTWRHLCARAFDGFGRVYFSPDGTYLESINYHQHGFNELLLHAWAMRQARFYDVFDQCWVKGSFQHFIDVQMPAPSHAMPALSPTGHTIYVDPPAFRRTPFLPNGNSGSEGLQQNYQGELLMGAHAYRKSDPALAGALMQVWQDAGRPLIDYVHPLLTLLSLDLSIKSQPAPWASAYRQTLGLVSKAISGQRDKVYAFFRAGRATHHMDFDQGHLSLAMNDRVLLGDPGYHAHDPSGKNLPTCATWPHSTIVYSDDKTMTSGYTGLEIAPDPVVVHMGDAFDWCVNRIVNTNFRCIEKLAYNKLIPCPRTVHVRHYLFVKPDYFLLWDVFEESHAPAIAFFHPHEEPLRVAPGRFRAGPVNRTHLDIQIVTPAAFEIVENENMGPMWSLGLRLKEGESMLTLMVPQARDRNIIATFDSETRIVQVRGDDVNDEVRLPPSGTNALPRVVRRVGG